MGEVSRLFKSVLTSTSILGFVTILLLGLLLKFEPALSRSLIGLLSSNSLIGILDFDVVVITLSLYSLLLILGNFFQAYLAASKRQYLYYFTGFIGFALQPFAVWSLSSRHVGLAPLFCVFCLVPVAPVMAYLLWTFARSLTPITKAKGFYVINKTSASYLIIQFTGALVGNLDLVLVSHYFGLKSAAVYSAFKLIIQVPISLHAQFNIQSWPEYVLLSHTPSRAEELRTLVLRNSRIAISIAAILVVGLSIFGPSALAFWSSETLSTTHVVAFLFSAYGAVYIVSNTLAVVMFAHGHTQSMLPVSLFGPPIFFVMVWFLKAIGIAAVVLSNLFVTALGLLVAVIFCFRQLGYRPNVSR